MRIVTAVLLAATLCAIGTVDALAADSAVVVVKRPRHARMIVTPLNVVRRAEIGDARAQAELGFMYEYGRRVPQDFVLAALWYRRSAEQGNPHGQHLLGLLYNKGRGVPENLVESYKWLSLAAAGAGGKSRDYYIRMRDSISSKMDRTEIVEAQRRTRVWFPVPERG